MISLEVVALSPYAREWAADLARRRGARHFRDHSGRVIELGEWQPSDWAALVAMYGSSDGARHGTGLPPLSMERRAVWLEQLLSRGPNVVARVSGRIVGHAALVAYDRGDSHELVVLVHSDYRGAGIGGALVDSLLRLARRDSVDRIWLTFDPANRAAAALFQQKGFRPAPDGGPESVAALSWGVHVWTLALSDESRNRSAALKRAISTLASASRIRLRAFVDAVRLVMIPLVCALVIAVASEDPRGRTLALALAVASLGFGVVVHGRAIVLGRPGRDHEPNDSLMSTGEWLAKLR